MASWVKGQSGNPIGRPKGAAGIARFIAEQTDNCQELIYRLLDLSRSDKTPVRERVAVTQELLSRAIGKSMQPSEITMSLSSTPDLPNNFDAMTPTERMAWIDQLRLLPGGDK